MFLTTSDSYSLYDIRMYTYVNDIFLNLKRCKYIQHRQVIDRQYRANKNFPGMEFCTLEFFYK